MLHIHALIFKNSTNNKCWRKCEEKGIPLHYGNVNWCNHYGKKYCDSFKNENYSYHIIQQSQAWACIQTIIQKDVHISTIYNNQDMRQPRCQSTDEWIKKMWYIYTMECYLAIKRMKECHL